MVFTRKSGSRIRASEVARIKRAFQREYGKRKGTEIFYATFTKKHMYKRHRKRRREPSSRFDFDV